MLYRAFYCALLAFIMTAVHAQAPLTTEIRHWPDGKSAAVALTFDDNVRSQLFTAIPELERHGYRGSFFIVAQWLDLPATDERLAEMWQQVYRRGHEIGSHSYSHPHLPALNDTDLRYQVRDAKAIIEHWIGEGNCRLFRFPWEDHSAASDALVRETYPLNAVDLSQSDKVIYTLTRTAADAIRCIDQSIADRGVFIALWHGVGGDFTQISTADFQNVLQYLDDKRADVWVAPLGEIIRYAAMRQQAKVTTDNGMQLILPEGMDRALYNLPLSLRTIVPAEWTHVCLRRGTSSVVLPTIAVPGGRAVDYRMAPGETWFIERYAPIDTAAVKLTDVATARFDTPEAINAWSVVNGKVVAADGVLRLDANSGVMLGDLQLADFRLRGRFRLIGDPAQRVYACWAGMLFRVRNILSKEDYTGLFYELANQPERSDFRPNRVMLWQQLGYPPSWPDRLCASGAAELSTGAWHAFDLIVQGDRLRYSVDDKLVFDVAGLDPGAGKIGLRAMNSPVELDDIVVSRIEL